MLHTEQYKDSPEYILISSEKKQYLMDTLYVLKNKKENYISHRKYLLLAFLGAQKEELIS